ncbi:hypothetical protein Y695_02544 [Hydrogenophaga sp. T4]|nr:hypothetical protein Y695_02544 [Hydrogenophaga sp. T4]
MLLGAGVGHGLARCVQHVGRVFGEGAEQGADRETEHAAVPVEPASGQILLGGFQIGLFHELEHRLGLAPDLGDFDVAEPGFGTGGVDAKHHQSALLGLTRGFQCIGHKRFGVGDQVVGGQHQHHRVVPLGGLAGQSGQGDRGRCVAPPGFQQVTHTGRVVHLGQQTLGEEQVVLVGDDVHVVGTACLTTRDGLFQQGAATQLHEGFGIGLARGWPQACACST